MTPTEILFIAGIAGGLVAFASILARHHKTGSALVAAMLGALDAGWRQGRGLRKVTTEKRDLFRRPLEPDELRPFDAAVIDPPRAGAEAQIARLAESEIERVVMVSCNPVTFARDAATLVRSGFRPDPVRVVDQFRWSSHVELASVFRRS